MQSTLEFAIVGVLSAAIAPCMAIAQESGATRHPSPTPSPYSREESRDFNSSLSQKEADIRSQIAHQPESAELLYQLALLLREEGKPRPSLDAYTAAAKLRTPTANDLRSVALDYVILKDYDDAIHWLERAEQMDPKNVDVLYSLGRCYYSKDRYVDAGKRFERVLAIDPTHLKAEENLGLVLDATNHPKEAEAALREAAGWAAEKQTDEWPFLDLGSFLLEGDRAAEAIAPLRTAVQIRSNCGSCREKLGTALLAADDVSGSIAELEEAVRLEPKDPKAHFELGRALRRAGQTERAKREFAASQQLYSSHSQE